MENREIIQKINNLIIMLKDADQGFHAAAQEVRDTELRTQLHSLGQQSATIWGELQEQVRHLGGDPKQEGTFTGKCRRIWMEIKTAFTEKDETVVLKDCLTGQESVQREFHEAVNCVELPRNIKDLLNRHFETVRKITSTVRERYQRFKALQTS